MVVRNEATLCWMIGTPNRARSRFSSKSGRRGFGQRGTWTLTTYSWLSWSGLCSLFTMAPHLDSTKVNLKPRRHHGYAVVLFIFGTLFPPLGRAVSQCRKRFSPLIISNLPAVAARFGIGKDFWLNLLLTICGYIPGMRLCHVISETQVAQSIQGMAITFTFR